MSLKKTAPKGADKFKMSKKELAEMAHNSRTTKLTIEETEEIKECFALFDNDKSGRIALKDLKVAIQACGYELEKDARKDLITKCKIKESYIDYNKFLEIMTLVYDARTDEEKMQLCF